MIWRMVLPAIAGAALFAATSYQTEIAEWRRTREANLKRDGGWLTVAGLFWLHEGSNTFGRDPGNEIVLPDGEARGGSFELKNGKVTVRMDGKDRELVLGRKAYDIFAAYWPQQPADHPIARTLRKTATTGMRANTVPRRSIAHRF